MSAIVEKLVPTIQDRTQQIVINKAFGITSTITTVDECITDGFSRVTGNMRAEFNSDNPKHMALYVAMEDVVAEMRVKRDMPIVVEPVAEVQE